MFFIQAVGNMSRCCPFEAGIESRVHEWQAAVAEESARFCADAGNREAGQRLKVPSFAG